MAGILRNMVWLNRLVLVFATFLFSMIAFQYIHDPVGAVAPHHVTLGSNEALTNTRVSGAVFLAIALLLGGSVLSRSRHLAGLTILLTVSFVLTAVRVLGLVVDGPAPFTLFVLKPEIVITVLSAIALGCERRAEVR